MADIAVFQGKKLFKIQRKTVKQDGFSNYSILILTLEEFFMLKYIKEKFTATFSTIKKLGLHKILILSSNCLSCSIVILHLGHKF